MFDRDELFSKRNFLAEVMTKGGVSVPSVDGLRSSVRCPQPARAVKLMESALRVQTNRMPELRDNVSMRR